MKSFKTFACLAHLVRSVAAVLLLIVGVLGTGAAEAQTTVGRNFDHLKTGFALTGEHVKARCESCHLNAVFKGAPRDCASCHQAGMRFARGNVVMSSTHLPTQQACDTCHTTKRFEGTKFNHTSVAAGTCATCHNGTVNTGKPASHIPTSATCDTCHRTNAWVPAANFDHTGVVPGTCTACHGTGKATGKSANHMPTNAGQSCDDCHKGFSAWRPSAWNHTQMAVTAQCATCHTGSMPPADGRPTNHIPYASIPAAASANCDTCHKGSFSTWTNGKFHSNVAVTTACSTCHTGTFQNAVGKPATTVHVGVTKCESCHTTSQWTGAKVDHSAFTVATDCVSCHDGKTATAKPAGHMPIGNTACLACHNVSPAGWKPTKWTHTQMAVASQCATCHTGTFPPADGKPPTHVPYQSVAVSATANCDACHKGTFTTWTTGRFHPNFKVSAGCVTCHTGGFMAAVGKPATTVHNGVTSCEGCHDTTGWAGAKVNHSTFNNATICASCHDGTTARAKPASHMPVGTTNCFACHNVSPQLWTPTKFNHTQVSVAGQCASCHTGGFQPADGKPTNHIPYASVSVAAAANCDGCHKASFTTWTNGKFHSYYNVSTGCATCHTLTPAGSFMSAVGKPSDTTHASVTGTCESCHKTTASWDASVDHSTFTASTNCLSCHNGSTSGRSMTSTHVPIGSTSCFACHTTVPKVWTPTKFNHTQVTVAAQCATCHSGSYPPADGKPTNHIPYASVSVAAAANCDGCHKASFTTWTNGKFHSYYNVSTGCATCHTLTPAGSFMSAVGKPSDTTHASVTGTCESCHKTTASWDASVDHSTFTASTNCLSCHNGSTSGRSMTSTHVPIGSTSCFACHTTVPKVWTPTKFNHTQVTVAAQCATCHSGSYPPADGKPTNHIPYASVSVAAAANCDGCHKASFTTWTNGKFHSYYNVSTGCATCHTLTPAGSFMSAVGKPSDTTHASVTGTCESCHKTTASWDASVDHSTFTASTNCLSCHNGSTSGRSMTSTHVPIGSTSCFACHTTVPKVWTPTKFNHTQVTVAAQCATCHSGSYPPADGKPTNHIPYASVSVAAAANCDGCHKASFTTWTNGKFHSYYNVSTGCATCHTLTPAGSFMSAVGKPSDTTHASVTGTCESCHKTTASWDASVDHSTFTASTNCLSCHNGSTSGRSMTSTHVPIGSTSCFACHTTVPKVWTPTKFNHTQVTVAAQCATCHSGSYPPADGKPTNHIPYASVSVAAAANCDGCHKASFTTWTNGKFHSYYNVSTGCATCHTLTPAGSFMSAVGKPSDTTHASVTGTCESCHKTTASWDASVDHSTFTASTNCLSCHNGSTSGRSMTSTHVPIGSTSCFACHTTVPKVWTPTKFNHTQVTVAAQCATCHSGSYPPADGKPTNHIPYASVSVAAAANCDGCHKASFTTWTNGKFHSYYSVTTGCATCHTLTPAGTYLSAVGKPSNTTHATVTGTCEACHKTTASWNASVDHSTFTAATTCVTCHNGSTAGRSMPGTHIPIGGTNCFACHTTVPKVWTPTKFNHTQVTVTAQCATCHSGSYPPADAKPTNHIPYASVPVAAAANCDGCHKASFTTWTNGKFHSYYSVTTGCATCHTLTPAGTYLSAVGKPSNTTHATVTGTCEACHKTTASWNASVDHSTFTAATTCVTCHNGSTAGRSMPGTHIPIGGTNCFACHTTVPKVWTPTKFNHTQVTVTAQCATCHSGSYPPADAKPTNHIPYASVPVAAAANCDGCHKASFTTWTNGKFHSYYSVTTGCATCHTLTPAGTYLSAVGKPNTANHTGVTGTCEGCHISTASWQSVRFAHSAANAVGTGTCDTCHNGTAAKGKSTTHIPIPAGVAKCDSCHKSQASFATSVTMNHTVVTTAQCKTCHNGAYTSQGVQGALGKPTNHIPEVQLLNGAAMDCNACHTSTTAFTTMTMNHNASQGNGSGWCKACHQSGTSYLGNMQKKSLTHNKSTGVTDCSQSGCHRPLGNKGTAYRNWD